MKYLHFIENHSDIGNIERNWVDVVRCENEDHVHYRHINSNGYEYVDLGLPSGNLWATMNIGAASEKNTGYRYAWGEVEPNKDTYYWDNYKFGTSSSLTKYTNIASKLLLQDDAAHVEWGGDWHMPSAEDFAELVENTTKSLYYNANNVFVGIYFISKVDSTKSIYIPTSSYKVGSVIQPSSWIPCVWTNDIYGNDVTKAFFFRNYTGESCEVTYVSRYVGMPIRPVITKTIDETPDYVKDGLLLFLDAKLNTGTSHSNSATEWIDRAQGLSFTVSPYVATQDRNKYFWSETAISSQGYTFSSEPPYFRNDWYPDFSDPDSEFTLVMVYTGNEVTTVRTDYIMGTAGGYHSSNNRWQLNMENGNINLYHNNGSWVNEVSTTMPQTIYNVFVLTKKGSRVVFYNNGQQIAYGTTSKLYGGTDGFAVRITNLASHCYMVYNRALSNKEIWQTCYWANNYYFDQLIVDIE